jgi:hypothetical protein
MLFFQSDHVIWIFQEGGMENSMPMQFLSSFLELIPGSRMQPIKLYGEFKVLTKRYLLVQQSTPHYMFRYIIIFDAS